MTASRSYLVGALVVLLGVASAADGQVTPDDIVDQILGQGTQPLQELDVTEDGTVDALDLACFVGGCNPPSVNFALSVSDVGEAAGTVQLDLVLSRSAFCTLNYTVEGSATAGVDYSTPSGTLTLAGSTASIPIILLDDAELDEELELLIISIETGSCYQTGAFSQHSLHILDNDRTWYGTLDAGGDLLGFQLEVVRTGSSATATLVSDGSGTLPPGSWVDTSYGHDDTTFSLAIEPVLVAAPTTAFAARFSRTFSFSATDGSPGQAVEPTVVRGSYTEFLTATDPGAAHLSTTITGTFSLLEGLPVPSSWEPPLDPSP